MKFQKANEKAYHYQRLNLVESISKHYLPTLQSEREVEFSAAVIKPTEHVTHMPKVSSALSL